ncbi:MAG: hypothetical protein CM15mP58_18900 [Burkholderiaceae bacterium]|nr:MAG: hypothetical protein CM15mP58_18900 [Burkholderiaceae bacterium]
MEKSIIIIGSGFSSLAASCYLAKAGCKVSVFEKNSSVGESRQTIKKKMGLLLILVPLGIGCQMFLNASLRTLEKDFKLLQN